MSNQKPETTKGDPVFGPFSVRIEAGMRPQAGPLKTTVTTPKTGMVTCPDCKGRGTIAAFVDTADDGWLDSTLQCSRCKGLGAVDRQQEEWRRIGGVHRTWRVAQHESIGECAVRLGIGPAELSGMEHGRADPTRLINDTPKELHNVW